MEKRTLEVKILVDNYSGPIWGLFPDDETVIHNAATSTADKAVEWFLEYKEDLISKGYTHLILPTGKEIPLK